VIARAAAVLLLATAALPQAEARQAELDAVALQEAEKIERSLVNLVGKIRESTVAVARYVEVDVNGTKVEQPGGVGSGVVIERDGKIFTNVHVVEQATRVEVVLLGGAVVEAETYAFHDRFDFALLLGKGAKGRNVPPADWARTSRVEPGQWAIAAGNPRGLAMDGEPIVTLGIVSGLGRLAQGRFSYDNAVQTDAEINPGNSGGPLFDLSGRIVGINGKIATGVQGMVNVGVGYAIPAQQIQNFLPEMASGGKVLAGYSGLQVEGSADPKGGVVVVGIDGGSPAHKAGMRVGDLVFRVNSTAIASYTDWTNTMALIPNGRKISIAFWRGSGRSAKTFTLEAPAAERSGR
jgi:serine protease Do